MRQQYPKKQNCNSILCAKLYSPDAFICLVLVLLCAKSKPKYLTALLSMALYFWFPSVLRCPAINIFSSPFPIQKYKYLLYTSPHSFSTCILLAYAIKFFHSYLFTSIYSFHSKLWFSICRDFAGFCLMYMFLVPSCLDTVQDWSSQNVNVWFIHRRNTFNTALKSAAIWSLDKNTLRKPRALLAPLVLTVWDVWPLVLSFLLFGCHLYWQVPRGKLSCFSSRYLIELW